MARIYVADDDPLLVDLLIYRLQRAGHDVTSSGDGEQVLDDILENPPDLLLLDYQMPIVSAHEIIDRIRQNAATRALPVFVLASQWSEQEVMHTFSKGITDYIIKPFAPDELIIRLERALLKRRSRDA